MKSLDFNADYHKGSDMDTEEEFEGEPEEMEDPKSD